MYTMKSINLNKYHEIAVYLRRLALEAESSGRDYCIADTHALLTASAAMDNLILKLTEAQSVITTFSCEKKNNVD